LASFFFSGFRHDKKRLSFGGVFVLGLSDLALWFWNDAPEVERMKQDAT